MTRGQPATHLCCRVGLGAQSQCPADVRVSHRHAAYDFGIELLMVWEKRNRLHDTLHTSGATWLSLGEMPYSRFADETYDAVSGGDERRAAPAARARRERRAGYHLQGSRDRHSSGARRPPKIRDMRDRHHVVRCGGRGDLITELDVPAEISA
jgi:hypothetical protein